MTFKKTLFVSSLIVAASTSVSAQGQTALPLAPSRRVGKSPPAPISGTHLSKSAIDRLPILDLRGGYVAAAPAAPATFVNLCGQLAPVAATALSLAPLTTVRKIAKNKNVGNLPLLPYSSLVANASVWLMYGVLLREFKVWSCNAVGFLLGLYYVSTFTRFSPSQSPTLPGSVKSHVLASTLTVLAAAAVSFLLPKSTAAFVLGKAGVAICIGLFASPLMALRTVVKTKSARSIPLPFALATAVNCALWAIVGVLDMKDVNVALPNLLGLACGIVQIALKLKYGDGKELPRSFLAG